MIFRTRDLTFYVVAARRYGQCVLGIYNFAFDHKSHCSATCGFNSRKALGSKPFFILCIFIILLRDIKLTHFSSNFCSQKTERPVSFSTLSIHKNTNM
jgi:hypothetical protein